MSLNFCRSVAIALTHDDYTTRHPKLLPLFIYTALGRSNGGLPQPDPRYGGFFDNLSAAELAGRQGVKPVARVEDLYGHGDPSDWEGFDEALAQWRAEHPTS